MSDIVQGVPLSESEKSFYNLVLWIASRGGHAGIIEFIASTGMDLNGQDSDGRTPLIHAAQKGKMDSTRALLAAGADISIQDFHGFTALGYAARRRNKGVYSLLKEAGAQE